MPVFHTGVPGFKTWFQLLTPASRQWRLWEAVVLAQVTGFWPPMWEIWIELPAFSFIFSLSLSHLLSNKCIFKNNNDLSKLYFGRKYYKVSLKFYAKISIFINLTKMPLTYFINIGLIYS